jgi:hypothetical protein
MAGIQVSNATILTAPLMLGALINREWQLELINL